jgi:RimJ/RimL family protein N-acetyltransferase
MPEQPNDPDPSDLPDDEAPIGAVPHEASVELADGTVTLVQPLDRDIPAIYEACQDPEIQRWTSVPSPYTLKDAEGYVRVHAWHGWSSWSKKGRDASGELTWAIHGPDGFAGAVGLMMRGTGGAEVGYWMAPHARGRGLLHRALLLVLGWAFDAPDGPHLDVVEWTAAAGNQPSWRTAWRAGFLFEGTARRRLVIRGSRFDAWHAAVLPDDPREPATPWTYPPVPQTS